MSRRRLTMDGDSGSDVKFEYNSFKDTYGFIDLSLRTYALHYI